MGIRQRHEASDEQAKVYAQGRTAPGKIVTHAKPGHSNHNFGVAFDVGIFVGGQYIDDLEEKGNAIKKSSTVNMPQSEQSGKVSDWTGAETEVAFTTNLTLNCGQHGPVA